ncbi:SGNH/GDSL hydrolase family protein [Microtetraspora malaysiensis]|uniref:SGNH/GDSL hydrolase family protein n=1 Tax=Microtetraspora malaysiensis TaxID=161358 RepID=UPI003D8B9B27
MYPTEESDPFCLSAASATRLLTDAPWRRFASMGDSLAAGTGDPSPGYANLGWPDRLAGILRRVRPDLAYLNAAKIGATTTKTLANQVGPVLEFGPDLIHISCGANDIWRPDPDLAEIGRNLRRIFERASETGAQLTTFTLGSAFVVPRFPDWHDRVRALNDITRELAATHAAVLVDMWSHPVNSRPNLLSADRVHFSTSGQAVMASELVKGLVDVLGAHPVTSDRAPE